MPGAFVRLSHSTAIQREIDHRLTTETECTNGDKGGQSGTNLIVLAGFFDCYLLSGRRVAGAEGRGRAIYISYVTY
jgi:hypothetical protein